MGGGRGRTKLQNLAYQVETLFSSLLHNLALHGKYASCWCRHLCRPFLLVYMVGTCLSVQVTDPCCTWPDLDYPRDCVVFQTFFQAASGSHGRQGPPRLQVPFHRLLGCSFPFSLIIRVFSCKKACRRCGLLNACHSVAEG